MEYNVALVGNPNVGKTSLFNLLTSSNEHVGNWHGVTVDKKTKQIKYEDDLLNITDLPGLYSLTVYSGEEAISRDEILFHDYDLIVCVCECGNISRNLYLALQLLELGKKVVIIVNMIDELERKGMKFCGDKIEYHLGVAVVPFSAKRGGRVENLTETIIKAAKQVTSHKKEYDYYQKLNIDRISDIIKTNAKNIRLDEQYCAIKLLENDEYIKDKLQLSYAQNKLLLNQNDMQVVVAKERYEFIDKIILHAISPIYNSKHRQKSVNNIAYCNNLCLIDKIVLNKYICFIIFFAIMCAIFYITFGFVGQTLSNLFVYIIESLIYAPLEVLLTELGCMLWLKLLICDGIIMGVGAVLVFLPQIVLLFCCLAFLEESGYVSRIAFMMDGIFQKIGLTGRSAFTLIMGFGCSAAAIMSARGLENEAIKKKTILLTPFFSCSAKLPIYVAIVSTFFLEISPFIITLIYFLGIIIAIVVACILQKIARFKSEDCSFIMELSAYRFPRFDRIIEIIVDNVVAFLVRVGTVVFALNVIVWILSNFSFSHGFIVGTDYKSIMQLIASVIAPIFLPLGFSSWNAVSALLSGVVAKEVVIASIASSGGISAIFVGEYAAIAAVSFMIFTLLYTPCIATLTIIKKEAGAKWMIFSIALSLTTAYVCALIFYWSARFILFFMSFY